MHFYVLPNQQGTIKLHVQWAQSEQTPQQKVRVNIFKNVLFLVLNILRVVY